jgi:hypothetical protein
MQHPLPTSCWRVSTGLHLPYRRVDAELSGFIYIGKFVTRQTKYACVAIGIISMLYCVGLYMYKES